MKQDNLEKKSLEIMRQCPRFDRCSVPICPLDLLQELRTMLPEEQVCRLPKSRRRKIGEGTELLRQGLTKKEWAAHKRWLKLTESERKRQIAGLRPFGSVVHGSLSSKQQSRVPESTPSIRQNTE